MFKRKKKIFDDYFDKEWVQKHSRYHSYSERYEMVKEKEFIDGLKNILIELNKTKDVTKNQYTGFAIREKEAEITYEALVGLNTLYRVYKDRNYLYSNDNVWVKIDNDLIFQIELTTDYNQGDYIYLTNINDVDENDMIIDYIDVVEQKESNNKTDNRLNMALKEIKKIVNEYKLSQDEIKNLVYTMETN